jgi:hypothetical protein
MTMTDTILVALVGVVVTAAVVLFLIARSGTREGADRSLHIDGETWQQLDTLAKELSKPDDPKTVLDLVLEGIGLVLQKYGKPAVS